MTEAPPLQAGIWVEPATGAHMTLPWPADPADLPPSLAPYVVAWAHENLRHHLTGQPWRFTRDQVRWLHLWYALAPDGRWLYRRGVKRGSKGVGKDPLAAAMVCIELLAPCRFAGWLVEPGPGQPGIPEAVPQGMPLVQIAANSEAQARDVLMVANAILPQETRDAYGLDCGITRTTAVGGGRIELLTAAMASAEGDPATFVIVNESQHMTVATGGHKLAGVVRRNLGKSPGGLGRQVELTNAHQPGADSVAERSYDAWQAQAAGRTRRKDILYDSREAEPGLDLNDEAQLVRGLRQAYHDAPWVDLDRIRDEIWDPDTPPSDSRRFYLNSIVAAEDAWVDPGLWDRGARGDLVLRRGDKVVLFGDGSKSDDASGIVACRLSDGYVEVVHVQHPRKGELVNRDALDLAVRRAFDHFDVVAFFFDPSVTKDREAVGEDDRYWWPLCDDWMARYGSRLRCWSRRTGAQRHAVVYDMRSGERQAEFVPAAEQTQADIEELRLPHNGSMALREHVHNARRRPGKYGVSLGKEGRESNRKVDLAICLVGARMLRRLVQLGEVSQESEDFTPSRVRGIR